MSALAGSFSDPANGDFEAIEGESLQVMRARRLKRRRQTYSLAAISHLTNAALLTIFAAAGTLSYTIVAIYAACAAAKVALFLAISERGLSDSWRDHFLAAPYTITTGAMMLAFIYAAPQVAIVFLSAFFIIANVVAFRASPRQGGIAFATMTGSICALYTAADLPLGLPAGNTLERIGTLLTFALTLGRIMFINIFATQLRNTLFRRSAELETAYKRIEELAERDELTGSLNRRSIMRVLEHDVARAHREPSPCSIALIDLDWFKRINDQFGHLTGDEVLRTFAICIFANIRDIDRFGRFGGEEFLLVLPDTPHDAAVRILDRLRIIVEELDWSAFSEGLRVTISCGVATLRPDETTESLLARADTALYAAKDGGRNRIVFA